mmetsp:Transcript_6728/g.6952  ORF Transcript_6728/g.6952 Transcript_6728/m.6952 type:complete len:332 (-) Transcript_6728:45-1040(-)
MFLFSSGAVINISFNDGANGNGVRPRKKVTIAGSDIAEEIKIFHGYETVTGTAEIALPVGKKLDHLGVKIEMIGQIELYYDRTNTMKFTSIVRELEAPGALLQTKSYPFEFNTEKPFESYGGINVRLRYFIRVTITRNYLPAISKEQDLLVQNVTGPPESVLPPPPPAPSLSDFEHMGQPPPPPPPPPSLSLPMKMEVGIEECLHIEFEYNKNNYHLKDVIRGKIHFLLVRIKIKHMELAIIRRESAGSGANTYNESESVTKFELMDGAPVKGEVVPIRLYLSHLDTLSPSYTQVNNVFSVKYYVNLVLVDEEDRRYFKQQEVLFWREVFG